MWVRSRSRAAASAARSSRPAREKWASALSLMEKRDWDLFWVVFTGPDKMQHFFWRFYDPEHPYYDAAKAEALAKARGRN